MTDPESDALELLTVLLGARPAPPDPCPFCGADTNRTESGALVLAAPCTKAGRHITFLDNALRIEFGLTWNAYWTRVARHGLPGQSPLEWVHSKERQRKWHPNPRVAGGVPPTPGATMNE